MYTLLIVEDENRTRQMLKDYVPWREWEIGPVLEAANGRRALELARSERPDLVITDIRMPEMDGIELAERLRAELPDTVIIMLSAYSELAYLRSAMKSKAIDYLLKPVDIPELEQAVRTGIAHIREVRERRRDRELLKLSEPLLREEFFVSLLEGKRSGEADRERVVSSLGLAAAADRLWRIALFRIAGPAASDRSLALAPAVQSEIRAVLLHACRPFPHRHLVKLRDTEWVMLVGDEGDASGEAELAAVSAEAAALVSESFELDVEAFAARAAYALYELHRGIAQLEPLAAEAPGDAGAAAPDERALRLVQEMKRYIAERYGDETLTVADIAGHLRYTSAHVCMVFKKATGMTLNHYVNLYRIRQAKLLLAEPSAKIFEVAVRVGYSNENYFSKVFRKYENKSPSDFRKGML